MATIRSWAEDGFGELVFTIDDEDGRLRFVVDRADPRVLVTNELVGTLQAAPEFVLFGRRFAEMFAEVRDDSWGYVLRILADNGTWVYRLTWHDSARCLWLAEWPD